MSDDSSIASDTASDAVKPQTKKKPIITVIVVIFVIAGICVGMYFFFKIFGDVKLDRTQCLEGTYYGKDKKFHKGKPCKRWNDCADDEVCWNKTCIPNNPKLCFKAGEKTDTACMLCCNDSTRSAQFDTQDSKWVCSPKGQCEFECDKDNEVCQQVPGELSTCIPRPSCSCNIDCLNSNLVTDNLCVNGFCHNPLSAQNSGENSSCAAFQMECKVPPDASGNYKNYSQSNCCDGLVCSPYDDLGSRSGKCICAYDEYYAKKGLLSPCQQRENALYRPRLYPNLSRNEDCSLSTPESEANFCKSLFGKNSKCVKNNGAGNFEKYCFCTKIDPDNPERKNACGGADYCNEKTGLCQTPCTSTADCSPPWGYCSEDGFCEPSVGCVDSSSCCSLAGKEEASWACVGQNFTCNGDELNDGSGSDNVRVCQPAKFKGGDCRNTNNPYPVKRS